MMMRMAMIIEMMMVKIVKMRVKERNEEDAEGEIKEYWDHQNVEM